jgi:hypothetical protein
VAVTTVILLPTANAATQPAAPFTALTLDAGLAGGSIAIDSVNATVTANANNGSNSFDVFNLMANDGTNSVTIHLTLSGATKRLAPGMTYQVERPGFATDVQMDTTIGSQGCNHLPGTLTVPSLTRDPTTQVLTSLAASYQVTCDGFDPMFGEIRWNSPSPYVAAVSSPPGGVVFGSLDIGVTAAPQTLTFTGRGPTSAQFGTASLGGANPSNYKITMDNCSGQTLVFGQTCSVSLTGRPTVSGEQDAQLVLPDNSTIGNLVIPLHMQGVRTNAGLFFPVSPTRLMDTRGGLGAPKRPLGPNTTVSLQIAGIDNLPGNGIAAAVLNVTATNVTGPSFITVSPSLVPRPLASSLNLVKGFTGANSVTVAVGSNGAVDIFNNANSTDVVVDITGYYANDAAGDATSGQFQPLGAPTRLVDTRQGSIGPLHGNEFLQTSVDFGAANNSHVTAFLVNITATNPVAPGFLAAFNGVPGNVPVTSTLNYVKGQTVPNFAVVPVAPCQDSGCGSSSGLPTMGVFASQTTDVIVDLVGFIDDGTLADGLLFSANTPTRIADSRTGQGIAKVLGPGTTVSVTTPSSLLTKPNTAAVALNVTAVNATASTFITVWPNGVTRPVASNLNPVTGQTIPNAVVTQLGSGNTFSVFNNAGSIDIVIDMTGSFWLNPATSTLSAAQGRTPARPTIAPRVLPARRLSMT